MKRITFLLAAMLLLVSAKTNAQDDAKRECTIKYNLFKGDFQSKKYDEAYANWIVLMDDCKDLSINIYKFGAILESMSKGYSIIQIKTLQKFIVIMQLICLITN
jgi:hypothetical protein